MKKITLLIVVFGLFLTGCGVGNNSNGISAQMRPENKWLVGSWGHTAGSSNSILIAGSWVSIRGAEIVLNDDGTGRAALVQGEPENFVFSIIDNELRIFSEDGTSLLTTLFMNRINDRRFILRSSGGGSTVYHNFERN